MTRPDLNPRDLPPGITITRRDDTGPIIEITTPACTARLSLRGAQMLAWQPAGHDPVLWLSPGARFAPGAPIRGGIPVCWPWFADHPEDAEKPLHGFARIRDWHVERITRDGDVTRIDLQLQPHETDATLWSGLSRPKLSIDVGTRLRLRLINTNGNDRPLLISQALHTYLAVGAIGDVEITGLDGATYFDKVTAEADRRQTGAIRFHGEVDRIYRHTKGTVRLVDPRLARTIDIDQIGGDNIIVWNPWIAKTRRLDDMVPDDSYRRMVCIETGSVTDDALKLAPGATHLLETSIGVACHET